MVSLAALWVFCLSFENITASFNRYICIGIAHDDQTEINHVVGASMIIQLIIIAVVLIVGETLGIWFINNYLVIAPEKLVAAHIVFQFSVVTFIINIFTSAYNSIIISYERMSIYTLYLYIRGNRQTGCGICTVAFRWQQMRSFMLDISVAYSSLCW